MKKKQPSTEIKTKTTKISVLVCKCVVIYERSQFRVAIVTHATMTVFFVYKKGVWRCS